MSEQQMAELVDDYLHGVLDDNERQRLEVLFGESADWAAALEAGRKRKQALESVPAVEASQKLVEKTIHKVTRRQQRRHQVWRWWSRSMATSTAAAVLILGVLTAFFYFQRPSPYEVRILGQRELLAGSRAVMRVGVFDQRRNSPVQDIPVVVQMVNRDTRETIQLASFKTGDEGTFAAELDLPDWDEGRYDLLVKARAGLGSERVSRRIKLRRSWKLMLSTDKPVYQPGQTIHVRSLALRNPELQPIADKAIRFEIQDPRGNLIFKREGRTSKFGISHVDCQLASEILNGDYRIACVVDGVRSERTVKVEKYVLPKFKLSVALDKPYYRPGENVEFDVQVDYFFGQPVSKANVRVFASEGRPPKTAKTNENGKAVVGLKLPSSLVGLEQESGAARAEFVVQVKDSAGQSETARMTAVVSNTPIRIAVAPVGGSLVQGIANEILIRTSSQMDSR